MPFRSKAQRRKFAELLVKGEISPETYEEWNRSTGGKKLPEAKAPPGEACGGEEVRSKDGRQEIGEAPPLIGARR